MKDKNLQLTIAYVTIAGTLLNTALAAGIEWLKKPSKGDPVIGSGFYVSAAVIILLAVLYIAALLYFTRNKK